MKKEIPILFSTPMVQAILDGRKTMTRRVVKSGVPLGNWSETAKKCPYGQPGDILWVREEHYRFGYWVKNGTTKRGNQKWMFKAMTEDVHFADNLPSDINHPVRISRDKKIPGAATWYKRLARFMPKDACRIWLRMTNVRVERLLEINPNDACDEGVEYWNIDGDALEGGELQADFKNYTWTEKREDDPNYEDRHFPTFANPVDSFRTLWQSINGPESWEANPWVWVVEFEVLSKTGRYTKHLQ